MKSMIQFFSCMGIIAGANVLAPVSAHAVAMPFVEGFDGSTATPSSNSSTWSAIDEGAFKALDTSTDGDIFTLDLTSDPDPFSGDPPTANDNTSGRNAFFASTAQGWNPVGADTTIEFRFRTSDAAGYFQLFDIINGERRWNAGFDGGLGNLIFGTGGGVNFNLDSEFHTLRLLINSDGGTDSIDAYLDDVLVKSAWQGGVATGDAHTLRIGDWSGSAVQTGSIDYDYISWTHDGLVAPPVPEPSALALSALGVLAITSRKRR